MKFSATPAAATLKAMPKDISDDTLATYAEDRMWEEVGRYLKTPDGRREAKQAAANIMRWNAKQAAKRRK